MQLNSKNVAKLHTECENITAARDDGDGTGNNWNSHQKQHINTQILTGQQIPSCCPANSVKALKAYSSILTANASNSR